MNIESWEILQFFDEPLPLPDMSYGLWAFRLKKDQLTIDFHLNLVESSASISIDSDIKQFININDLEKIESSFDKFLLIKKSGKVIELNKKSPFSFHLEI